MKAIEDLAHPSERVKQTLLKAFADRLIPEVVGRDWSKRELALGLCFEGISILCSRMMLRHDSDFDFLAEVAPKFFKTAGVFDQDVSDETRSFLKAAWSGALATAQLALQESGSDLLHDTEE